MPLCNGWDIGHTYNQFNTCRALRAGPGVSPASPWARATPHPRATNGKKKKNYIIHIKKISLRGQKKYIVINKYTQQTNIARFYFIFYNKNELRANKLTNLSYKPKDNQN